MQQKEIWKNATGVNTSDLSIETDLAKLKSDVDKLGADELKNLPNNLSNLKSKVDKLDVDKLVSPQKYHVEYIVLL